MIITKLLPQGISTRYGEIKLGDHLPLFILAVYIFFTRDKGVTVANVVAVKRVCSVIDVPLHMDQVMSYTPGVSCRCLSDDVLKRVVLISSGVVLRHMILVSIKIS